VLGRARTSDQRVVLLYDAAPAATKVVAADSPATTTWRAPRFAYASIEELASFIDRDAGSDGRARRGTVTEGTEGTATEITEAN